MYIRIKKVAFTVVLCSVILGSACGEKMRTWTSKKGDTIEAMFVRTFAGGKVILKTSDGKDLKIPVSGLSVKDQEYVASLVPPKLKINADFDADSETARESEYYVEKLETVKGVVDIEKTNKEPCSKTFTIRAYVFAKKMGGKSYWLIGYTEKKDSFKGTAKNIGFRTAVAETAYETSSWEDPTGFRYDGYLVVVEDDAGETVAIDSNRGIYEKNWNKIKGAEKGHEFNRDFDRMSKKRRTSFGRNY